MISRPRWSTVGLVALAVAIAVGGTLINRARRRAELLEIRRQLDEHRRVFATGAARGSAASLLMDAQQIADDVRRGVTSDTRLSTACADAAPSTAPVPGLRDVVVAAAGDRRMAESGAASVVVVDSGVQEVEVSPSVRVRVIAVRGDPTKGEKQFEVTVVATVSSMDEDVHADVKVGPGSMSESRACLRGSAERLALIRLPPESDAADAEFPWEYFALTRALIRPAE